MNAAEAQKIVTFGRKATAIEAIAQVMHGMNLSLIVVKKQFSWWSTGFVRSFMSQRSKDGRVFHLTQIAGPERLFLRLLVWHYPHAHFILASSEAAENLLRLADSHNPYRGKGRWVMIEPMDQAELVFSGDAEIIEKLAASI